MLCEVGCFISFSQPGGARVRVDFLSTGGGTGKVKGECVGEVTGVGVSESSESEVGSLVSYEVSCSASLGNQSS